MGRYDEKMERETQAALKAADEGRYDAYRHHLRHAELYFLLGENDPPDDPHEGDPA